MAITYLDIYFVEILFTLSRSNNYVKMTATPSIKQIEQSIEKNRSKNTYLDPAHSLQCLNDLRTHILEGGNYDTISHATIVLASVLRLSKRNDAYLDSLDETLLSRILGFVNKSLTTDVIIAVLRILLLFMKGKIFETLTPDDYLIPLLNSINSNLTLIDVLAAKLYVENVDLIVFTLEFLDAYVSINHIQLNSTSHMLELLLCFQNSEFPLLLNHYYEDPRFSDSLQEPASKLLASMFKMYQMLNGVKINESSSFQQELVNKSLSQLPNLTRSKEKEFILGNYSMLQLLDLYFFFENPNISFRKTYHEQLLFNLHKEQIFPVTQVSYKMTNKILGIHSTQPNPYPKFGRSLFLRDMIDYSTLAKLLEIWNESKAEIDDLDTVLPLVDILYKYIDDNIDPEELDLVGRINELFKAVTYNELRQIQLNNFKAKVNTYTRDETASFDLILKEQVFDFVKNQRFLQLAKGSWVYADLPSFKNSSQTSSSYYFIILSPNFKQLLFKEYKFKTSNTPNIDKIGNAIDIASIANFKIEEIHQVDQTLQQHQQESHRLINLVDKTIINKITLLNRKSRVLFSFHAKKSDSLIWLDGLNLLIGNNNRLSDDLNFQMDKLFEVRKTIQLLNFDESANAPESAIGGEGESLEFLEKLATNFYYT